jgi:probable HAF family extracellular repeat protein
VNSTSEAINDRSQIVGAWWKLGNSGSDPWDEAVLWQGGKKMIRLGALRGGVSHANAINERGQVVGWSESRDWYDHAVLWTPKRG